MPRTRECDFCGADIEPGTGTMLVRNDGSTVDFCSSKCENNVDLGRESRDVEWTAEGRGPETEQDAAQAEQEPAAEESEEPEEQDVEVEAEAEDDADAESADEAAAESEADADAEDEEEAEA